MTDVAYVWLYLVVACPPVIVNNNSNQCIVIVDRSASTACYCECIAIVYTADNTSIELVRLGVMQCKYLN